jgi:hypothetical protein
MTSRITGYGVGAAKIALAPVPALNNGVPTSTTAYDIGQLIKNTATGSWYLYSGGSTYLLLASSSGDIVSVTGTANQVTASTTAGAVTLSIPSTFIAPGSIASTTTLTGGTGITATTGNIVATAGNITTTAGSITSATTLTATLGNITATAGNFVASAAASGLVLPVTTGSGAASGTVNCNGRVGSVSFTSPSIAGGATQLLTVGNTSITGSGTVVLYSVRGATTGAALNIQSVVNSANSSAVTLENGTGATTQSGTIILDFIVLN